MQSPNQMAIVNYNLRMECKRRFTQGRRVAGLVLDNAMTAIGTEFIARDEF